MHGYGGEWRVERQRLRWDVLDAFALAAQEAGIPSTTDFNTGNNEGVAYFEVNQRTGTRWNTRRAFLSEERDNLTVQRDTMISRVLFDGSKRATGTYLEQESCAFLMPACVHSCGACRRVAR